jgi:molybdenum cofactor cytidylyltransferase
MISAIILAAGESRRMGQPKMLLPWGNTTVLGHVISSYQASGMQDIVVVTGGAHDSVEKLVIEYGAQSVFNRDYRHGEMLSSIQHGLQFLFSERTGVEAALIGLGDQPQVQAGVVQRICDTFREGKSGLVVPSFQMRRGHPWIMSRSLWDDLLRLKPPQSPREFLTEYAGQIQYVEVGTSSILADLDTPEDYEKFRP